MTWKDHNEADLHQVKASIIVVSDSLFSGENDLSNDVSGPQAIEILSEAGISTINIDYYPDDISAIQAKVDSDVLDKYDLIIFMGGTGIFFRDVTIEAISVKFAKEIIGFGEEFRRQSIAQIGGKGMLSRASCGIIGKSLVVGLPGSPKAVELGLNILLSFLGHALKLINPE